MGVTNYEERVLEMVAGQADEATARFLTKAFYEEVLRVGREEPFSSLADSIHCAGIIGAGRLDKTMELELRELYAKTGFGFRTDPSRDYLVVMANAAKAIYTQIGSLGDERRKGTPEQSVFPTEATAGEAFLQQKPRTGRLKPSELRGALQTGRRSFMPFMIFDELGHDDKNAVIRALQRELAALYGSCDPALEMVVANVLNYRRVVGADPRQAAIVLIFEMIMLNFVSLPLGANLCHDVSFDGEDVIIRVPRKKLNRGSIMPCIPLTRPA